MERAESYNIGWDAVGDRCVTTAAIPCSVPELSNTLVYETLIWEWDGEKRNGILDQINHPDEIKAKKVHDQIVKNLREKIR